MDRKEIAKEIGRLGDIPKVGDKILIFTKWKKYANDVFIILEKKKKSPSYKIIKEKNKDGRNYTYITIKHIRRIL